MLFLCLKSGKGTFSFSQMRSLTFPTKAGEPTILVQTVGSLQQLSCLPRMPSMAISASQVKFCLYFFHAAECPVVCFRFVYHVYYKGCPKKGCLQSFEGYIAQSTTRSNLYRPWNDPVTDRFVLQRLSGIKSYLIMFMGKFGSTLWKKNCQQNYGPKHLTNIWCCSVHTTRYWLGV